MELPNCSLLPSSWRCAVLAALLVPMVVACRSKASPTSTVDQPEHPIVHVEFVVAAVDAGGEAISIDQVAVLDPQVDPPTPQAVRSLGTGRFAFTVSLTHPYTWAELVGDRVYTAPAYLSQPYIIRADGCEDEFILVEQYMPLTRVELRCGLSDADSKPPAT